MTILRVPWNVITLTRRITVDLGSVYTGQDPIKIGMEPVKIGMDKSFVYTELSSPVRIGSVIWYQMRPLMKLISEGTVPF